MKIKLILSLASAGVLAGTMAFAAPITPHFGTFGTLAGATFSGTGIPNDNVAAYTQIVNGNDSITLGLTASQRYSNPALTGISGGVFHATTGENNGLDGAVPPHALGPTWNFDWYINLADNTLANYHFVLLYGNNTTGASTLLNFGPPSNVSGTAQDSWNLDMGFLDTIGFNPNDNGVYGFELEAFDSSNTLLGSTAINVIVGSSVPDTASSALLLGLGCVGLLAFGFAQKRLQVAAK